MITFWGGGVQFENWGVGPVPYLNILGGAVKKHPVYHIYDFYFGEAFTKKQEMGNGLHVLDGQFDLLIRSHLEYHLLLKIEAFIMAHLLSCHMSSGKSHFLQANQN